VSSARTDLWVGTYPAAGAGTPAGVGEGVWRVTLDLITGTLGDERLVVRTPAPSFLAVHPSGRIVYAVGETEAGTVTSVAVGSETAAAPAELNSAAPAVRTVTVASGGSDPCHLLLSPDARTLYVANYSSGTLGVLPLTEDGEFAPAVRAVGGPVQVFAAEDSGSAGPGPDRGRQDGPHAHFVALAPGGRHLLVVDLGTDELRRYLVGSDGLLVADGIAGVLPPGTGPRHVAMGPGDHLYVTGELDCTVHVLRWDERSATALPVQALPACRAAARADGLGSRNLPSHVVVAGDLVHVGVRGADVVSTFAIEADGGRLGPRGETPTGGTWPRHLAAIGSLLVVADQVSSGLSVLSASVHEGALTLCSTLTLPSPACVIEVVASPSRVGEVGASPSRVGEV
jgi:6-phosphogluconolactonase